MSDYGLDPRQFVKHIVRPTLDRIGLPSRQADVLVLGTALVESRLRYVDQIDKADKPGPAFGVYQCEGPTHAALHRKFLVRYPELRAKVLRLAGSYTSDFPDPGELVFNLAYATAICRVHYRDVQAPLPAMSDAAAMADYHKRYYNTYSGKTRTEESVRHFQYAISIIEGMA